MPKKSEKALVLGDQSLLMQLTLNLIENAIKYNKPHGSVHLSISERDGNCILTIKDGGIGISKENLPHIFERFYRADTARDRSGTGLGLSIVQWIVKVHGGDIHVQSQLDQGTEVAVSLPSAY